MSIKIFIKYFKKRRIKIKKKGNILAEILIAASILSIFLNFIYIKYENLNERIDMEKACDIFETTVHKYTAKSLAFKNAFDITFDYDKKEIRVKPIGKDEITERIELPEKLRYTTIYKGIALREISFSTKTSGNLSKSFSVYICDYSENVKYRIAYYNFQQSRILKINVYKNVRAGKIKYEELEKYHYNIEEDEVKAGWEKQ